MRVIKLSHLAHVSRIHGVCGQAARHALSMFGGPKRDLANRRLVRVHRRPPVCAICCDGPYKAANYQSGSTPALHAIMNINSEPVQTSLVLGI